MSYNPDVLSCLANLSNDEVFTPPAVVNKMLDLLPQELFESPETTFLDPAAKSGVFLREITKRLIVGLEKKIPDLQQRVDHILHKQVFGIATTELTSLVSRRSLYCSKYPNCKYSVSKFDTVEGNIRFRALKHTFVNGRCKWCGASASQFDRDASLESHAYKFIHTSNPEEIFNMKFDVIIGNPPYQMATGGSKAQAIPLYHRFVSQARNMNPHYLIMIVPDRWFSGGFGLNDFRNEMLNDTRIRVLYDFPLASDCFPGVDIPGGICFFKWDRDSQGLCDVVVNSEGKESRMTRPLLEKGCDVFVKYNEAIPILRKVMSFGEYSLEDIVSTQRPFDLPTNFIGESVKTQGDVKVVGRNKSVSYIARKRVEKNVDLIDKWKVFISRAYGERISTQLFVLGKPFVGEPGTVCTETYITVGNCNNSEEVGNIIKYLETRFARFLVLLKKPTQDTLRQVYSFVPLQDFSKPWTDEELYKKYGLTKDEIAFIESMIKPME